MGRFERMPRRDLGAYLFIAGFALLACVGIHIKASFDLAAAKDRFRAESHAAAMSAVYQAQDQFKSIFENLRTISRLPTVKAVDREATNFDQNAIETVQEIYNNLASDVSVSEVYIVSRDLDADRIDPVTGAPQTPIYMFDDLISDDAGGGNVTKRFEAEIYEYHLLHKQMLWFDAHVAKLSMTDGFDLPMISGPQVITCDNTVYNVTLDNSDRTGMIFSVPFFGPDGNFKGTISAIIRVKAIRSVLPGQNFALVNPTYGAFLVSPNGLMDQHAMDLAQAAQPDPRLIYSEVLPLDVRDPQATWSLWSGVPNAAFYGRNDVKAARLFEIAAYLLVAFIVIVSGFTVWLVGYNARLMRRASGAMESLANGNMSFVLRGAEKRGSIGEIARAFAKFRDALLDKQALEEKAAADRAAADELRRKTDGERSAALAMQKRVVDVMAKALLRFTNGDLTMRILEDFEGDYRTLRHDFNAATEKMEGTMQRVVGNARRVKEASDEVGAAAADLSKKAETQAVQLEETAAALEQINSTVRKSAEGAHRAAELAVAARADAATSGAVVETTVAAMKEIEKSSKQIGSIIGVIDEIAFQTNLLALNAGVEAARAGDAGRGFAVVATEVRALAQRSANAAKEIKAIISTAGQQVGNGVRLVTDNGQALLRISGQINQLCGLVDEMAGASKEQANALRQVTGAVAEMDQVTQRNAVMLEMASAAAESLRGEAALLSGLVAEFSITDNPDGSGQAARRRPVEEGIRMPRPAASTRQARQPELAREAV